MMGPTFYWSIGYGMLLSVFTSLISKANDHDGYDHAEFTKPSPSSQTEPIQTVQNPYYGGEDEINESESSIAAKAERTSLRENIKVTDNPYYE